jgi:DNA-binding NtrC family response regulator
MQRPEIKILTNVLDDNEDFIFALKKYFEIKNHPDCNFFTDPEEMVAIINSNVAAVCLIDYRLAFGKTGIDVIKAVRDKKPLFSYFIVMSAQLTEKLVIDCVNEGGCNKILKKDNPEFMQLLIQYLDDGVAMAQNLFDKYSEIWERFLETDKLFQQLTVKEDVNNNLG